MDRFFDRLETHLYMVKIGVYTVGWTNQTRLTGKRLGRAHSFLRLRKQLKANRKRAKRQP